MRYLFNDWQVEKWKILPDILAISPEIPELQTK
jgi:hypothetical protein